MRVLQFVRAVNVDDSRRRAAGQKLLAGRNSQGCTEDAAIIDKFVDAAAALHVPNVNLTVF